MVDFACIDSAPGRFTRPVAPFIYETVCTIVMCAALRSTRPYLWTGLYMATGLFQGVEPTGDKEKPWRHSALNGLGNRACHLTSALLVCNFQRWGVAGKSLAGVWAVARGLDFWRTNGRIGGKALSLQLPDAWEALRFAVTSK